MSAEAGPYIGRSIPRVEDQRFLTGKGRYTDDFSLEGEAYCAFVRSPHAHARIVSVDIKQAAGAPGVLAVLTGADYVADGLGGIAHMPNPADAIDVSQRAFTATGPGAVIDLPHWPLASDRTRHVGEPVAVVVATSAAAARDAAEQASIDYEPLPAVVSVFEALREGASRSGTMFQEPMLHAGLRRRRQGAPHPGRSPASCGTNSFRTGRQLPARAALRSGRIPRWPIHADFRKARAPSCKIARARAERASRTGSRGVPGCRRRLRPAPISIRNRS
jgi:CO/xanthine dehydrogenase Mo-binding subunit